MVRSCSYTQCIDSKPRYHRYRRNDNVLCFRHVALAGVWLCLDPLPNPRFFFPSDVKPRDSRCLWTGLAIQLIRGSRRMALCCGLLGEQGANRRYKEGT